MTLDPDDIVITIALGPLRRHVFAFEVAEALMLSTEHVTATLASLLRVPPSLSTAETGKEGTIGMDGASESTRPENANSKDSKRVSESVEGEEGEGSRGGEEEGGSETDPGFAGYLADRLGDAKSLAFYERVVGELPHEVVLDAVCRALDCPEDRVRKSRAALFTHIVLPRLRREPRNS